MDHGIYTTLCWAGNFLCLKYTTISGHGVNHPVRSCATRPHVRCIYVKAMRESEWHIAVLFPYIHKLPWQTRQSTHATPFTSYISSFTHPLRYTFFILDPDNSHRETLNDSLLPHNQMHPRDALVPVIWYRFSLTALNGHNWTILQ